MSKPLLPAIDAAGLLREVSFGLLLRDRAPIELDALAAAAELPQDATRAAVSSLTDRGWLDRDDAGRITGAAGLSLATGPHGLELEGRAFRTWCAYDALGISAALVADSVVETTCGECSAPIHLAFVAGVPERTGPERLWLAEGGADLRGSFCTPTVLLCRAEHGAAWAAAQGDRGQLVDLAAAAEAGGADWAGCAAVAGRLA